MNSCLSAASTRTNLLLPPRTDDKRRGLVRGVAEVRQLPGFGDGCRQDHFQVADISINLFIGISLPIGNRGVKNNV